MSLEEDAILEDAPSRKLLLYEEVPSHQTEVFSSPKISIFSSILNLLKDLLPGVKPIQLIVCFILAGVSLAIPISDFVPAVRCFSILVLCGSLWATEAIPLYVTSLIVPVLVVVGGVLSDSNQNPLSPHDAASTITGEFMAPSVFLFMAGFSIGAALNKEKVSIFLGGLLLSKVGKRPSVILLACMFIGFFLSMWVSNVPASVLTVSLVMPIVKTLPRQDGYIKQLLMGVAIACNIGGMSTPIASPQNAIALQIIGEVGKGTVSILFSSWVLFAVPLCILFLLIAWRVLIFVFPSPLTYVNIPKMEAIDFGFRQYFVSVVTVLTITLWATSSFTLGVFGDIGIISFIPLILFFGSGIMTVQDFDGLKWNVLTLIGGGLALGYAMNTSTLLASISKEMLSGLKDSPAWVISLVFTVFIGIIGNFISHTVTAIIVLPIVAQVGVTLGDPKILIMGPVLLTSGTMSLPVSSFPNANTYSQMDQNNQRYVEVTDYFKSGLIMTLITILITASLGYLWAILIL